MPHGFCHHIGGSRSWFLQLYIVIGSFPINENKITSVCNPILLLSHARRLDPSLGWAVTKMASLAKLTAPVLLAGKSLRTLGLRSFCAPVMSPRGKILDFSTEPLV
jgi:hypothetical protein